MNILFEDKHLIVAFKPAGIASQPDPSGRHDMLTLLKEKTGGEVFCVHRLDTQTAGVMAYAKTSECAGRLTASLSAEDKIKQYLCVVHSPDVGAGRMEDLLFHDKRKNKAYVVDRVRAGVKSAALDYETLAKKDGLSLVRVTLDTGRTHQIRVQFASRKMPLQGDGKYGAKDNLPLHLHCYRLGFTHPYTKKYVDTVSLPDSPFGPFDLEDVTV